MKTLKKHWVLIILFLIFFNIGYFGYRNRNYLKTIFLINQIDQVKEDIQKLESKIESIQGILEKIKEEKPEDKPAPEKNRRRNRANN